MWYKFIKESGRKEVEEILNNSMPYEILKEKVPEPKFQPIAAYFLAYDRKIIPEMLAHVFKKLAEVLVKRNIKLVYTKNGIVFGDELYMDFIKFSEEVDALHSVLYPLPPRSQNKAENSLRFQKGKIQVRKAADKQDAVELGVGSPWCISDPSQSMWQSYRDAKGSTFYFILDGTREQGDPLRRVVLDVTKGGVVELTDLNNRTGTIKDPYDPKKTIKDPSPYLNYLQENNVDLSQFVNDPLTEEEIKESELLSNDIYGLESFKNLETRTGISYAKSKYIGRGHKLNNEQFK